MVVNINSERRKDHAEFFMMFQFEKFAFFAGIHIVEILVSEIGEFFGEAVVREINDFGRVSLDIFFMLNNFHTNSPLTEIKNVRVYGFAAIFFQKSYTMREA